MRTGGRGGSQRKPLRIAKSERRWQRERVPDNGVSTLLTLLKIRPMTEAEAYAIFDALRAAGFVGGISLSIWGSRDGKRWEVRCTPVEPDRTAFVTVREPDRWDDGTAIWGAR